jgi:hypothetical protein
MRPSLEQRPEMCWPVMASRCARCGDRAHPPRDILAAHEAKHLDHLVSRSSYRVKLLFQLSKRVPAKSFSVGLAWRRAAWMACADKAHPFDGDGGAEACSSTPQAASTSTLVALRPPLGAWYPTGARPRSWRPRQPLTPASCSKLVEEIRPAPSAHELEGVRRLDSLGYHTGPSEPQRTRSGRTTC